MAATRREKSASVAFATTVVATLRVVQPHHKGWDLSRSTRVATREPSELNNERTERRRAGRTSERQPASATAGTRGRVSVFGADTHRTREGHALLSSGLHCCCGGINHYDTNGRFKINNRICVDFKSVCFVYGGLQTQNIEKCKKMYAKSKFFYLKSLKLCIYFKGFEL